MFTRFLKTVFLFSFLFSLSLNAYQMGLSTKINCKKMEDPTKRVNEDKIVILNKKQLLEQSNPCDFFVAVCDGHKSSKVSNDMSEQIFNIFNKYTKSEQNIKSALEKTFVELNNKTEKYLAGSTAVVCCKSGLNLSLANVGDSKAVLFRKNSIEETREHKATFFDKYQRLEAQRIVNAGGLLTIRYDVFLKNEDPKNNKRTYKQVFNCRDDIRRYIWCNNDWEELELGSADMEYVCVLNTDLENDVFEGISEEWYVYCNCILPVDEKEQYILPGGEMKQFFGGLAMSRSFGDAAFKTVGVNAIPDFYSWDLKPDDKYLVVASDGLWNAFDTERVEGIIDGGILCGQNVEQLTRRLCNEARLRGCPDDISVVLVVFDDRNSDRIINCFIFIDEDL